MPMPSSGALWPSSSSSTLLRRSPSGQLGTLATPTMSTRCTAPEPRPAGAVPRQHATNFAGLLSTTGDRMRIGGRDRGELLDGVQRQAGEVTAALIRLKVTPRCGRRCA